MYTQFFRAGKITSAVCHGPAAIVGATDAEGKSIFKGRKATGFSDLEEEQIGKVKDVPFLLEARIKELGGAYEKAPEPWKVSIRFSALRDKALTRMVFVAPCRPGWQPHHWSEPGVGAPDCRGHRQGTFGLRGSES